MAWPHAGYLRLVNAIPMAGAAAQSGRTVGICPGCGYPVMGTQPCAVCAPLLTAAHRDAGLLGFPLNGPTIAA